MKLDTLIGKTLESVWVFPSGPIHPAWVNERTTPINTSRSFLQLADGSLLQLSPCEVTIANDQYPALGLELIAVTREALVVAYSDGRVACAVELQATKPMLPSEIISASESDALGEGTTTEYSLTGVGWRIIFRHIMPPTTLGISVESSAGGRT